MKPRRRGKIEITERSFELRFIYENCHCLYLSFHSLSLMAPYAVGGQNRPGFGHVGLCAPDFASLRPPWQHACTPRAPASSDVATPPNGIAAGRRLASVSSRPSRPPPDGALHSQERPPSPSPPIKRPQAPSRAQTPSTAAIGAGELKLAVEPPPPPRIASSDPVLALLVDWWCSRTQEPPP